MTVIALIVVVAVATSGVIAYHLSQTKSKADSLAYAVTINYYCETVPNDTGVIRVVGTTYTNYNSYNCTFGVNGFDFYLRDGNHPEIPQTSMITEGGTGGIQNLTLYNNSTFEMDFSANENPSDYHLVFSGGKTVAADNGVPCNLKLVDQTQ